MRKSMNRILSLLLCVMMLVTMLPVSAFATEQENNQQFMDSGTPPQLEDAPKHWLQQYQEAVLAQLSAESSGIRKIRAASNIPSFDLITWLGSVHIRASTISAK